MVLVGETVRHALSIRWLWRPLPGSSLSYGLSGWRSYGMPMDEYRLPKGQAGRAKRWLLRSERTGEPCSWPSTPMMHPVGYESCQRSKRCVRYGSNNTW